MSAELRPKVRKESGVHGWLVNCPKKGHMAAMRCGEYQERDGCGKSCPRKADPGIVLALSVMRDSFVINQKLKNTVQPNAIDGPTDDVGAEDDF